MTDTVLFMPTFGGRANAARQALLTMRNSGGISKDIVVIVDDPPSDIATIFSDLDIELQTYPVRRGPVGGLVAACGHALATPQYQYIMFLEDGVGVVPNWDYWMRRVLEAHPQFGWVACLQAENAGTTFTSMASMMTRAALEASGGWDATFAPAHYDDSDLVMRMRAHGFTPHGIPIAVHHPTAQTSNVDNPEGYFLLGLAHQRKFAQRWGYPDFFWHSVPCHQQCPRCEMP